MLLTIGFSVAALGLGAAVGWLWRGTRETAIARRRAAAEAERVTREGSWLQRAIAERDLARNERLRLDSSLAELQGRLESVQQLRTAAETRLAQSEHLVAEKNSFLEQSRQQLENSFAALAQTTLRTVSDELLKVNKAQLDGSKGEIVSSLDTKRAEIEVMLKPLREMLDSYRLELTSSENNRNAAYGGLQAQITNLLAAQESAQRETSKLVNALRIPNVRGSWGENSLKNCVELAGMSEFCDFSVQETFSSDEGRQLRPDMVVRLPNKRIIAVDSKAPIDAYLEASAEPDADRKTALLDQHARNLRKHVDMLSRKEYHASIGDTVDFTVMFIAGEQFLSSALVTDPAIFEHAVRKKVYLASPTVLLPLLRAVAAGWKAEKTEESARRVHEAGLQLFERFVTVMDHFTSVGKALQGAVGKYNSAIRSIDTRLWPKGEELQRMVGSGKQLGILEQIDTSPVESNKLRLSMQNGEGESLPDELDPLLVPRGEV